MAQAVTVPTTPAEFEAFCALVFQTNEALVNAPQTNSPTAFLDAHCNGGEDMAGLFENII